MAMILSCQKRVHARRFKSLFSKEEEEEEEGSSLRYQTILF